MTDKMTAAEREILHQAGYGTHTEIMEKEAAAAEQKKPKPEVDLDHKWEPAWRVFQVLLAVFCVLLVWDIQDAYNKTGVVDGFKAALAIGLVLYGIMVGIWRLWLAGSDLVRDLSDDSDAQAK